MLPAEQAARLREQIEPEISEAEYNRLFRELHTLDAEHPELQSPDSPTLRVGAVLASAFAKHTHRRPMLSLANAFSPEELADWGRAERATRPRGEDRWLYHRD
jgi:DNA ligase (NAD+)